MAKQKLEPKPWMFPKPAVMVGALVDGKPNFMTIANCGVGNYDPPMIFIACDSNHHTCKGIRENQTFSVNIPSADLAVATDFVGINHGHQVDKSKLFEVFFGELLTAPMVGECPVCMECKVVKVMDFDGDETFFGQVIAIYVDDQAMTGGKPDVRKIDPLIYSTSDKKYYRLGDEIGPAYSLGKNFKAKV